MNPKYPSWETSQQISIPHQLQLRSEHVRPNKFFKPSANQNMQRMKGKINIYVYPFDPVCLSQLIISIQLSLLQLEMWDIASTFPFDWLKSDWMILAIHNLRIKLPVR